MNTLISTLQSWPVEAIWLITLLTALAMVAIMHRLFGVVGVAMYIFLALVMANIQVLQLVDSWIFPQPVALGTILFTSIFFATDLVSECHGARVARRLVLSAISVYGLWVAMCVLTLGYAPLSDSANLDSGTLLWQESVRQSMATLLGPSPGIFVSSVVAFLVSQMVDITIFERLRRWGGGKQLWLRNNISTAISTLIDNAVFSILAFAVLTESPLPMGTIVSSYILGTWMIRLGVGLVDTPFLYWARWWWRLKPSNATSYAPDHA